MIAKAVRDTGSFLHRVECGILSGFVDVYSIFIFYLIFCIQAAALIILLMLFGHPNVTAIQMSCSNLVILSFDFQSLESGFIVRSYFIVN